MNMEEQSVQTLNLLIAMLPFLVPLAIIQFGLMIAALVSIFKHQEFKVGNQVVWIIIVIVVNIIGPILYFALGRKEE